MENNDIYEKYEGLVKSIAKKYINNGIPFEDLVQHGYVGLWQASERFNESLGYEFSTYATNWIKNAIEDEIYKLSDLSKYKTQQVNKMKKIENELTQELKRTPTNKELADKLGKPVKKIIELKNLSQQNISLQNTFDNESNYSVANTIADESMTPEEQIIDKEKQKISQMIKEAFLKTLNPIERKVYNLKNEKKMKINNIANQLYVGTARIKAIEKNIEKKHNLFFQSKEYYKLVDGKTDNLLKKIVNEYNKNLDASVIGEKFAEYEDYDNLLEKDFKELKQRFDDEYATSLKYPTFEAYFTDLCEKKSITKSMFARATGLSDSQYGAYKNGTSKPSIEAIVAFGIYFKISLQTINTLLELGGFRFKINDRTHIAYTFILEECKGYPIEYCNKILELLGIKEDNLLHNDKRKKGKRTKKK